MTQTPMVTLEQIEAVLELQERHGKNLSAAELLAAENHLLVRQAGLAALTDQAMPSGEGQGGENVTIPVFGS